MNNISIMKDLLSLIDGTLVEANLPSASKMKEIEKFISSNKNLSKDEIVKYFTDTGLSKSSVTNGVNKIQRAAAATKAAGNASTGSSKLMQWVKDNPTKATIAGAGGIAAATKLGSDGKTPDSGSSASASPEKTSEPEISAPTTDTTTPGITPTPGDSTTADATSSALVQQSGVGLSKEEEMELHALAFDLEKMQKNDPNIAKILEPYYKKYGKD